MDSIKYPAPSPFKCPTIQIGGTTYIIIDNSYNISDVEDNKFSHSHHLCLLFWCNNKEGKRTDLFCSACRRYQNGTTYYFCNECDQFYHRECVESPSILISPFHPKYPLQLVKLFGVLFPTWGCHCCGLPVMGLCYYSSICDLIMDPVCARKLEFSDITNPKRHEHILHYFPRKASLTCNVCGLDDNKYCFYICLQCDFVVHGTCIYLPRVILISFHNHRLSFTSSLPSGNWICRLCRQKINENYGEYSCTKGCPYAVHSKCATQRDVWDGKELEDQPEMVYDNLKSFEEIGDGIIRHFSHTHHYLRLHEDIERGFYDGMQHCRACMLPLFDGNVYRCMECDFALHEACANLPRVKQNVMHPHWYILKPSDTASSFSCFSCKRQSCGFKYMCCEGCDFRDLDVKCASLSELAGHQSHPHPLFFIRERGTYQICSTYSGDTSYASLNCVECDFTLCFRCATLPYKVKHEDDEHMLTLSYERNANGYLYWCQICEETTDPKKGYYACNECGVTFHIECTLQIDNPYVKAGQTIISCDKKIEIIPNNRLSRLICNECHRHCQYKVAYKTPVGDIHCSLGEINWNTR